MSIEELIEQYRSDEKQLDELQAERTAAQQKLAELEADTESDLDKVANSIVKTKGIIDLTTAKTSSLAKRQEALRGKVLEALKETSLEFKQREKEVHRQRVQVAEKLIADEWELILKKYYAIYALKGFFWRNTESELNPSQPTEREAVQAAIDLNLWISGPEEPSEIQDAKSLIGYDRFEHGQIGSFVQ